MRSETPYIYKAGRCSRAYVTGAYDYQAAMAALSKLRLCCLVISGITYVIVITLQRCRPKCKYSTYIYKGCKYEQLADYPPLKKTLHGRVSFGQKIYTTYTRFLVLHSLR